jgi:hypothetical protein
MWRKLAESSSFLMQAIRKNFQNAFDCQKFQFDGPKFQMPDMAFF